MAQSASAERKAAIFAELHSAPAAFILANGWDAVSARLFERAGFAAVATTSAGVAAALGASDGEAIGREDMLRVLARMVKAVEIPVSADIESGFGTSLEDLVDTVRGVIDVGAVGINLEDVVQSQGTLFTIAEAALRVQAARETAQRAGFPLFINARTDVYQLGVGAPETRFDETVRRAKAFIKAGANGIFVPGVSDGETIAALAEAIAAPLNILCGPKLPPLAKLSSLGVRRVSLGSWAMRSTMGYLDGLARELIDTGEFTFATRAHIPYAEMNALWQRSG